MTGIQTKQIALLSALVLVVLSGTAMAQDYAFLTIGPPTGQGGSDHSTYLLSDATFARGDNLRCTFTTWFPEKALILANSVIDTTIEWGGVLDATSHVMIGGPFTNATNPPGTYLFFTPEAMIRFWGADATGMHFAQPDDGWPSGGIELWDLTAPLEEDFNYQFIYETRTKANALEVRVTLGNTDGAMMEWRHVGEATWRTELDTRDSGTNTAHADARVCFMTYGGTLFVDDVTVENDTSGILLQDDFNAGTFNESLWTVSEQTTNGGGTAILYDLALLDELAVEDWDMY